MVEIIWLLILPLTRKQRKAIKRHLALLWSLGTVNTKGY
jgi:hypothetical protein